MSPYILVDMETAYDHRLIVTSNRGSLVWQPEDKAHDDNTFVYGGYLFGPLDLQQRTLALLFSQTTVPGLVGYDLLPGSNAGGESGFDRTISLAHNIDYPLRVSGVEPRPEHTSLACDLVAAMTAAHGDFTVSYNAHAQQVVGSYIAQAYPGFFDGDEPDDLDDSRGMVIY